VPETIQQAFALDSRLTIDVLVVRLLAALIFGICVAVIYRVTHGRSQNGVQSLMATLVMLSVLIALVTLIIGENQARAFSLVGALAIIRFRTVVEDTRDTAFVIFAVAVGMGAGAGYLSMTLLGMPIAAVAAFLFRPIPTEESEREREHLITVRVTLGCRPEQVVTSAFREHLPHWRLISVSTARQGAALEASWSAPIANPETAISLIDTLNKLDGVQSVEIKSSPSNVAQ
jgi:uncharacterized membrane protein YhiD involved in acid resistance